MAALTPLFEPLALPKLIEHLPPLDDTVLYNRFPKEGNLTDAQEISWDVVRHTQKMARPNVRGAKAHSTGQLGRGHKTATAVYMSQTKDFDPALLRALRDPGQLTRANAEKKIAMEVASLRAEQVRFVEYCFWGMMTGTLALDYADPNASVNAVVNIDYGLPSANKPTVGVDWSAASLTQLVEDMRAFKKIVTNATGVKPNEAYASDTVMNYIFDAVAADPDMMSDRMKDAYYATGTLPTWQELTWHKAENVYDPDNGGALTPYFGENSLIIGNFTENSPIKLVETAPESLDAPAGFRGQYATSWENRNPAGQTWLMEWGFAPVDERPEQRVYIADVTSA